MSTFVASDEQYLDRVWTGLQNIDDQREAEEEICWCILEREHAMNTPVVEAEISINSLVVEVR